MKNIRIKKLQIDLEEKKIDAYLVSSAINIEYLTGYANFSKAEREAFLFVTGSNAVLFTDPRYIEAVEKTIPTNIKATIEKPVSKTINQIVNKQKIKRIGFESNLTFAEYKRFTKVINTKFVLIENFIEEYRSFKDADEIIRMKKAAKLTDATFEFIKPLVKIGVSEQQIAYEIEMYIKKFGGTLSFDSVVAFGPNASIPHHFPTDKKLTSRDEFVKLDFGAKLDGYCCDMTRTILTKNSSPRAKKVYSTVLEAQLAAIKYLNTAKKPNGQKAYEVASEYIVEKGFPAIPHGLGHGIGIEVHEEPHLSAGIDYPLYNDMVFSVEPGIYIPGFGGVRIEDTCLLNNGKIEPLTRSPK